MPHASLVSRMLAAMGEMGGYTKDNEANLGKFTYSYEDFAQVDAIVTRALSAHGLAYRQSQAFDGPRLITRVCDVETGDELVVDERPLALSPDPQANGKAETYARRYALKTAFRLVEADDDGRSAKEAYEAGKTPQTASRGPWDRVAWLMAEAVRLGCKEDGVRASFENYKTERGYDIKAIERHIEGLIEAKRGFAE